VDEHRRVPARDRAKELYWIDGASHNDLYDKPQYVDPAVEKRTSFFTAALRPGALVEAIGAVA
jgi:fermentation-respiration switch protein FrsA (DUF1100 family)